MKKEIGIVGAGPSGSGHHRSGILRFREVDISKVKAIELVKRCGGYQREGLHV